MSKEEPASRNERAAFEAWISAPPYERGVSRFSESDPSWPGSYAHIDVDLAWLAWKSRATVSERPLLPDVVVEALKGACYVPGHYKEIAHRMYCRWCSYAMGHPHGDKCVMNLVEQQGERPER